MSGRSRGRKSSRAKSRGKSRAKARACAASDDARRDAHPPPYGEEAAAAAQVQAGPGRGGVETAGAGRGDLETAAPARGLPPDRDPALRAHAAADPDPAQATATSLAERLAGDAVFVGTVGVMARPKHSPRGGSRRVPTGRKPAEGRSGVGPGSGSGPPAGAGAVADTLETVQLKLETMNAQADRAYLRLSRKFGQLRLHHLQRRSLLIQSIPGFWVQAFQNHPQLASLLSARDREVLRFLSRLEVEELGLARLGYKIKLYFGPNPYFQNQVLVKEYGCGPSGHVVCRASPIQWLPGHDLQSLSQGGPGGRPSFFGWFSSHSSIESDKIVEIINEDLWPNPLQYYLLSEGARGERGAEPDPRTPSSPR